MARGIIKTNMVSNMLILEISIMVLSDMQQAFLTRFY